MQALGFLGSVVSFGQDVSFVCVRAHCMRAERSGPSTRVEVRLWKKTRLVVAESTEPLYLTNAAVARIQHLLR